MQTEPLKEVAPGASLIVAGNRVVRVPAEVARGFRPGDALHYVDAAEELLHIPQAELAVARSAVDRALAAFERMGEVKEEAVNEFFRLAAAAVESDRVWERVRTANDQDVDAARSRGRSTTRLVATDALRRGMAMGLRGWAQAPATRGQEVERVQHEGWAVSLRKAELGVVAFVFEGRPNVVADATGVLKGGNTVVFRIGRDALRTARCLLAEVINPSLAGAGLPDGAVTLVDSAAHAAGWALFCDRRLGLAVARGSGRAVDVLGGLARQAGVPVSLHGTGGAWVVTSSRTGEAALRAAVERSLDRKVCNTLNVCCIQRSDAARLLPAFFEGLEQAGRTRGQSYKLHVVRGDEDAVPAGLRQSTVQVVRADGVREEPRVELLDESDLGREWEWEETPEVSLKLTESPREAAQLFNRFSPRFVASLLSDSEVEQREFYQRVAAPFVGDGHTRWVDGQVALNRPELGLSNWQEGRLLARAGILSGDGIFTLRAVATTTAR